MFAPGHGDTFRWTCGNLNGEPAAPLIELERKEMDARILRAAKMGKGAVEATLSQDRNDAFLEGLDHSVAFGGHGASRGCELAMSLTSRLPLR